jgi:hypothetical protein
VKADARPFPPLFLCALCLFAAIPILASLARAGTFADLCADRTAIERVYHEHRLGDKPAFEQALPAALIAELVHRDLHKAAVLETAYGVVLTPAQIQAEVARIDATTRDPAMLAGLRRALGGDPARFARTVAQPILVERELRARFDHDARLHAETRRAAEAVRVRLLAGQSVEDLREIAWRLGPRPAGDPAPAAPIPTRATLRGGAYTVEATAQLSQVLAAPR